MTAVVTSINLTTPKGRLVQGSAFELQTKDAKGNPRVVKTGPNAGQPSPQAFIAVAFPKNHPDTLALRAQFDRFARESWPSLYPTPGGPCMLPNGLSDKWIDGDGVDETGQRWSSREGFAGHWVLRCSSGFLPKVYNVGHYDPLEQVTDPRALQRGYFIRVSINVKSNANPQKPGLYVNMSLIEITEIGPVIQSGPDAATVFGPGGGQPAAIVHAPAPAAPAMPGPTHSPAPLYIMAAGETFTREEYLASGWTDDALLQAGKMTAAQPAAPAPPPAAPAAPAPPAPPPAAPAPPPAAPAAPGLVPTAAAQYSLDQYRTAGWDDARLIADGLFIRQ